MRRLGLLVFLLSLALASVPAAALDCPAPEHIADGWSVSSPMEQGLDPSLLCEIGARLLTLPGAHPNGVVIVRNGVLVYERYFEGPDQRWPARHWREPLPVLPHDAETLHDIQSSTKSVLALLVGIAIDRGVLKGVDTPALDYFPEYVDLGSSERSRISIRDLLTMRAGLRWPTRPYLAFWRKVDAAPDPYRLILAEPVTEAPGTLFKYNNGSPELVGAILSRATGQPIDAFARDALFAPLDIKEWEWGAMANGSPGASWGLRMRPRDFAKIGQLILNRGQWRGRRIVSEEWINAMIAPQVARRDGGYGYYWWIDKATSKDRPIDVIRALGWGGQILCVIPSLDLVVATTAGAYDFDGGGTQGLAADTARNLTIEALLNPKRRDLSPSPAP